jgi:hypothetical protein
MKTSKKALIFFLVVLMIKDAFLGSFLLINLNWILSHAGMTYSSDVKTMASFFGVCVLIVSTLCLLAINWVISNKPEGIYLSKFIGWWMVIAAIIVYIKIGKLEWSAIDFITGALILIPAFLSERKTSKIDNTAFKLQ